MLTETDHDRTREVLAAQAADYAELSRRHAARGESRRAALAVWAADVRALQCLLWESEQPEQQLAEVSRAVETALADRVDASGACVRDVVEEARRCLLAAFDASVSDQLRERFVGLDHLDDVPAPSPGSANQSVTDRLDGRGGEELVGDLLTAASDARAVAHVMAVAGDEEEVRRQSVSCDLAGFEAYLVLTSAASGDATLATTELRWDLAAVKAEGARSVADVRAAMRGSVVPAEERALMSVLDR